MRGMKKQSTSRGKLVGSDRQVNTRTLGKVGRCLRYQVLLTVFALDILGLGAGHVHVCGVRAVLQQVMEGVQVVRLRSGWE